jgi:hypothetical protein
MDLFVIGLILDNTVGCTAGDGLPSVGVWLAETMLDATGSTPGAVLTNDGKERNPCEPGDVAQRT